MLLDTTPITEAQAFELARFLAAHDLPPLASVPVVQRMLLDDMYRYRTGQPMYYIRPTPRANWADEDRTAWRKEIAQGRTSGPAWRAK